VREVYKAHSGGGYFREAARAELATFESSFAFSNNREDCANNHSATRNIVEFQKTFSKRFRKTMSFSPISEGRNIRNSAARRKGGQTVACLPTGRRNPLQTQQNLMKRSRPNYADYERSG
jgi:hypothetical protein